MINFYSTFEGNFPNNQSIACPKICPNYEYSHLIFCFIQIIVHYYFLIHNMIDNLENSLQLS